MEEVRFLVFGNSEADRSIAHRMTTLGGVAAVVPPPEDVEDLRKLITDYTRMGPGLYLHPGTGHWKRRSELPALAADLGATVLGPSAHTTALWNHHLNFLSSLELLQIPNLLVGLFPFHSAGELKKWLHENQPQLPLRIRSVSGRGSFASYMLRENDDPGLELFFEQLKLNVSDALVMIERYREGGRHVRLPFVRLGDGRFFSFSIQDLSIQYRGRPWLEITPVQSLSDETLLIVQKRAADIAAHTDYIGVGAIDFILDGTQSYLHQGIPGLTESYESWQDVVGSHALDWQLAAAGIGLAPVPSAPAEDGCSIYFRITAEDPLRNLIQKGRMDEFEPATEMFRHDYDVANGRLNSRDYSTCLKSVRESLKSCWFSGEIQTNEHFLKELLLHPMVQAGTVHRDFLEEEFIATTLVSDELIMAAADACSQLLQSQPTPIARWTSHRKKIVPDPTRLNWVKDPVVLPLDNQTTVLKGSLQKLGRISVYQIAERLFNVRIGDQIILVRADQEIPKNPKLYSLLSGTIHSIFFREGNEVPAHQPVILIESQKLLFSLPLPVKVRLTRLNVSTGDRVHLGEDLADLEVIK